jgi:hypothetical protein
MMKMQCATASVLALADEGLVFAVVAGDVTLAAAPLIIAGSVNWPGQRLAHVVSYQGARVELRAEDLFRSAMLAKPGDTPTAFVVAQSQLAMFRQYSQMHTARGTMKAAFTNVEEARRWAANQALVRATWARWRRALAASP